MRVVTDLQNTTQITIGARLAREEAVTFNINVD